MLRNWSRAFRQFRIAPIPHHGIAFWQQINQEMSADWLHLKSHFTSILSIVSVKYSMSIDSRNQIEYLTFYIRKLAIEIEQDLHNTDSKNKRFCCFLGIKIVTLSVWKNFLKWHLISFYFEEIILKNCINKLY